MNKIEYIRKVYQLRKKMLFLYRERERIERLKYFELRLYDKGFKSIAGIDEVGRGALAGPVVAAAVILKDIDDFFIADLKDSKKINKKKRGHIFRILKDKSCDIGIGVVESEMIDKLNIAQATFLAMKRAIRNLKKYPDFILVDAFKIPNLKVPQDNLIKGEDKSISIAAASIIAKVYRDQLMNQLHRNYPAYQFNQNVGYGTTNHLSAIKEYGICPIHRRTYKGLSDCSAKKQVLPGQKGLFDSK